VLDPTMLALLNEQHRADIRRECEAERLAQLALEAAPRPNVRSAPGWPRLTWPRLFGLRRRHVAL
jgi:hypothetical protein